MVTEPPSRRRALLEEILDARSRVVAGIPINEQDPDFDSILWKWGAARVSTYGRGRQAPLQLAVLALAWLEAFDAQPPK